jgi:hypothetical protein
MIGESKKHFSHRPIFGWTSIKLTNAYILMVASLLFGILIGGSPFFQSFLNPNNQNHGSSNSNSNSIALDNEANANRNSNINDNNIKHLSLSSSSLRKNTPISIESNAVDGTAGISTSNSYSNSNSNNNYNSNNAAPRLLFMTASYTMDQLHAFQKTIDSIKDICNSGWNVTIHVQSASDLSYDNDRYNEFQNRLWCDNSNAYIPLIIEKYNKIGFGLNSRHRLYMRKNIYNYDYFVFAEEDMILTITHLKSFITFYNNIKKIKPKSYKRYTIGFLRYEDSTLDGDTERVSWEYRPNLIHVATLSNDNDNDNKEDNNNENNKEDNKFIVTNNLNQAIYLFTQEQVIDLHKRCNFLYDIGQNSFYRELRRAMDRDWKYMAAGVSEWSSSFQQVLQCGMRRIIPLQHYEQFMIHHAVNKAQNRRPRKELLNARQLHDVIQNKLNSGSGSSFSSSAESDKDKDEDRKGKNKLMTVEEAYNTHIFKQYNLDLIDKSKFIISGNTNTNTNTNGKNKNNNKKGSLWTWGQGFDESQSETEAEI